MKNTPLAFVARVVLLNNKWEILIVKHRKENPWTLPGGHLEANETFQDACVREIREEFNLIIELIWGGEKSRDPCVIPLCSPVTSQVIEYTNHQGFQRKYAQFFLAEVISGTVKKQDSEIYDYAWKSLETIEAMKKWEIYEGIREVIMEAFEDDED